MKYLLIVILLLSCNQKEAVRPQTSDLVNQLISVADAVVSIDSICYDAAHARYNVWMNFDSVITGDYLTAAFIINKTDTVYKTSLLPRSGKQFAVLYAYESGCAGRIVAIDNRNGVIYSDKQKANCKTCQGAITTQPAHIIVVFMENHSYDDIIGNADAAYINSLADSGTLFTNYHGVTHPSQPNYVAFFSGDQNGVTKDDCLANKLNAPNLYSTLEAIGKTCVWYSEDLPEDGSTICKSGHYVRKHNSSSDFTDVPDSCNKMFSEFPTDFNTLPNLVIISPNMTNDMHSGSIKQGDDWIRGNLRLLADWCKVNNSIFIVTFDEDDRSTDNHIFTTAYGENVLSNNVVTDSLDHYNMTKTISSLFGASTTWTYNLQNRTIIIGF